MITAPINPAVEVLDFICPECRREFKLSLSNWRDRDAYREGKGRSPFCSNQCNSKAQGRKRRIKTLERKLAGVNV